MSQNFCHAFNVSSKNFTLQSGLLTDQSPLEIIGHFTAEVEWQNRFYSKNVCLAKFLIATFFLGLDILSQHQAITIKFSSSKEQTSVCLTLKTMSCEHSGLTSGVNFSKIKPIVTSSRPKCTLKNHFIIRLEILGLFC